MIFGLKLLILVVVQIFALPTCISLCTKMATFAFLTTRERFNKSRNPQTKTTKET